MKSEEDNYIRRMQEMFKNKGKYTNTIILFLSSNILAKIGNTNFITDTRIAGIQQSTTVYVENGRLNQELCILANN